MHARHDWAVGDQGEQQRSAKTVCKVHVSLPDLGLDAQDRLHHALHFVDRKLGVIVGQRDGVPEFTLLTSESTERAARERAEWLLERAATSAGIGREKLGRVEIKRVVTWERNLTGLPRIVRPPDGAWQTIDLGERGELRALHEGPLGDWIVYLSGDEDRAWAGRQLFSVLTELFDLPHGRKEPWVHALVERLAGHETPLGIRYACPCCDFLTLEEPPVGTFAICPVCWWEDDNIQFDDLHRRGPRGGDLRSPPRRTHLR